MNSTCQTRNPHSKSCYELQSIHLTQWLQRSEALPLFFCFCSGAVNGAWRINAEINQKIREIPSSDKSVIQTEGRNADESDDTD